MSQLLFDPAYSRTFGHGLFTVEVSLNPWFFEIDASAWRWSVNIMGGRARDSRWLFDPRLSRQQWSLDLQAGRWALWLAT